jgi:hypothetical protein
MGCQKGASAVRAIKSCPGRLLSVYRRFNDAFLYPGFRRRRCLDAGRLASFQRLGLSSSGRKLLLHVLLHPGRDLLRPGGSLLRSRTRLRAHLLHLELLPAGLLLPACLLLDRPRTWPSPLSVVND